MIFFGKNVMPLSFDERAPGEDSRAFRAAFGRFATGVAIAACAPPEGPPLGVTINSLVSVSLDPPLALFCLESSARSAAAFLGAERYAFNILRRDQEALSNRFARDHVIRPEDGVEMISGAPVFPGILAAVICAPFDAQGGGDHVILIGRVLETLRAAPGEPLLYHAGGYAGLMR